MAQWRFDRFDLHSLRQHNAAIPEPGPGEVRLRLTAISLNYRDLLMINGSYNPRLQLPLVPCSDAVGVVDAIGPCTSTPVGSRHVPLFAQQWLDGPPRASHLQSTLGGPLQGTLQHYLVVPEVALVAVPDAVDDLSAACLPCAGVTALHALEAIGVSAQSKLLTLGTGGVSLFALQLARARGAQVAICSSSSAKQHRCEQLGASFVFDYTEQPKWGRTVSGWAGEGVDGVIELGGVGTIAQSIRATRVGGTIALIGVLAGTSGSIPLVHAVMRSLRLQGIMVGSREHARRLVDEIVMSGVRPIVDAVFPFERAPEAFAYLRSGKHFGKVVIRVS